MDDLRKGAVITHSGNRHFTDSAAGATPFACGIKTYNGAIGVDMDTLAVASIMEAVETRGMNTTLVTTAEISHASPAGFSSHVKIRKMQTKIAVL